jgi:hypothetical protein
VLDTRSPGELLFSVDGSTSYVWLSVVAEQGHVELCYGVGLADRGYKGVPLTRYLAHQLSLPFRGLYGRLVLRAAADGMLTAR